MNVKRGERSFHHEQLRGGLGAIREMARRGAIDTKEKNDD